MNARPTWGPKARTRPPWAHQSTRSRAPCRTDYSARRGEAGRAGKTLEWSGTSSCEQLRAEDGGCFRGGAQVGLRDDLAANHTSVHGASGHTRAQLRQTPRRRPELVPSAGLTSTGSVVRARRPPYERFAPDAIRRPDYHRRTASSWSAPRPVPGEMSTPRPRTAEGDATQHASRGELWTRLRVGVVPATRAPPTRSGSTGDTDAARRTWRRVQPPPARSQVREPALAGARRARTGRRPRRCVSDSVSGSRGCVAPGRACGARINLLRGTVE